MVGRDPVEEHRGQEPRQAIDLGADDIGVAFGVERGCADAGSLRVGEMHRRDEPRIRTQGIDLSGAQVDAVPELCQDGFPLGGLEGDAVDSCKPRRHHADAHAPILTVGTSTAPHAVAAGRGHRRAPQRRESTLFNRLIGSRLAIISDVAGTTRDRVYGTAEWNGRTFTVVDTGGLELDPGTHIEERVQDQARVAVEEADLVLFVVDAHAGLAPLDHEVADRLRRAEAPVILVVNKGDNPAREADAVEFYALGMDPTITISAQHGRNTGDLADLIVDPSAADGSGGGGIGQGGQRGDDLTEEEMAELAEVELGAPRWRSSDARTPASRPS